MFGFFISIAAYYLGTLLQKKTKISFLSPFIVAVFLIITVLLLFEIDYKLYNQSANVLTYLLTPATVCLAIPLYQNIELLKQQWKGILAGITVGVLINGVCIFAMSKLFGLEYLYYISLLPKSVTVAIGIGICSEYGGVVALTVAGTIFSGISGNMAASLLCQLFRIRNPIARGVAIGTASHAVGTARALEMGRTEGAMSGLSIALTGLITVAFVPLFVHFF
jgi:predicted murein hydrolase (TIGR00659 family)